MDKKFITKAIVLMVNYKYNEWAFSEVARIPLFKRAILSGQKAGINEFFILYSGKKRHELETTLNSDKRIRSKIDLIDFSYRTKDENDIFSKMAHTFEDNYFIINGNSVFNYRLLQEFSQLKLKDAIAAISINNCNIIFSKKEAAQYRVENHSLSLPSQESNMKIYSSTSPLSPPCKGGEVIKSDRIPLDIEELSKRYDEWYVKLSNNNIVSISQDMESYDGKATGIILASPGVTKILTENLTVCVENADMSSNPSFSPYKWLESQIKDENIMAFDAKDNLCMEVVSKPQLQEYERRLYNSLYSPVDGPIVDKYINRKVSRIITKQLVKTPVTPNQTTLVSMVIGFVAAWFFWKGGYWNALAGGLVFQLSFIFDQCDGEIARLTFMESRIGGWFDAFCDSIIRTFIILGMTGSLYIETNQSLILLLGILSSIGIFVSTMAGSYETLKKEEELRYENRESANASIKEGSKIGIFIDKFNNTDSFSIILFICILSGKLVLFLWTIGIGSFIFTLVILAKSLMSMKK
ncbi:MAG: CDP-alcohol phosphatidyltransferase family protein [Candidatus Scalinduaceae bacterium]